MRVSLSKIQFSFSLLLVFSLTALFLSQLACSRKDTGWEGRIGKEGDVVVVNNPNEPIYGPEVFFLEEDQSIRDEEGGDYIFASISSIAVNDDGTIFVLDQRDRNIKVFDRNGERLRTIGKPGQGPGEFSRPLSVHCIGKDEIVVVDASRRFEFFNQDGEHVRTLSAGSIFLMDARPDSAGNIYVYESIREETDPRYELRKVDGELNDLFVIESSPLPNSARDGFDPLFPILRWARLSGNRVVCGHAVKYELRIYDAEGRLERKIQMDPDPVPVAHEDVDERSSGAPQSLLDNMKVPKHYPVFRYISTDDEDRIWVLSWERPPGRKGYYFDVFDPEGRYILRAALPMLQPLISGGNIYAANETEDGYPVLKRYQMIWNF